MGALSPPTRLRLVERHGAFLDMVHTQGDDIDGTVTLKHFDSNCVTEITVSNPASRGSITGRMMLELAEIVDQLCPGSGGHHGSTPPAPAPASNDIDSGGGGGSVVPTPTRGLILRGTDQFFSSGANFPLCTTRLQTNAAGVLMGAFMTDALTRIRTAPFISVAVLNGPALGGGAELATAPDFRIVRGSGHPEPYAMFVHAKVGICLGRVHRSVVRSAWPLGRRRRDTILPYTTTHTRSHCIRFVSATTAGRCISRVGRLVAIVLDRWATRCAPPPVHRGPVRRR